MEGPMAGIAVAGGKHQIYVVMNMANNLWGVTPQPFAAEKLVATGAAPNAIAHHNGVLYIANSMDNNISAFDVTTEKIKDFTLNIYILLLYLFKTKLKNKYRIIDKPYLDNILNINKFENPYEDLGDFIFTQYINEDFEKNDFIDAIKLLNVVITCFVTSH